MKRNDISNVVIEYENYLITKEEQCITLYKLKQGVNKETKEITFNYVILGYYSSVYLAAKRMLDDVDNYSSTYLQTYLNRFEAVYRDLKNIINAEIKEG